MKVTDPVCGMSVDTDHAPAHGVYAGKPVYFCSGACKTKYERSHGPES